MPPTVHLVRHAQAEHNISHNPQTQDPLITSRGKEQCTNLRQTFQAYNSIDLIVASPLRRTIQTAVLTFGTLVDQKGIEFLLLPEAQEVSGFPCNIGLPRKELEAEVPKLFGNEQMPILASWRMDCGAVVEGWNSKQGIWSPDKTAVEARAAKLRAWIFARPEKHIVLVTHGAFLHYLTENWSETVYVAHKLSGVTVAETSIIPQLGTSWRNCESRRYEFTAESNEQKACLVENEATQQARMPLAAKTKEAL